MIKRTFILYLVAICSIFSIKSQTYFNNRYSFSNSTWNWGFNVIENDSGYIVLGEKQKSGEFLYTGIMQIDFIGNKLFEKVYGDTTFFYFCGLQGSFQKASSGGYIAYGTKQSVSRMYDVLYRFNDVGDTLWTKQLGDTGIDYNGLNIKETIDRGFICIGDRGVSFAPIFIIKTDSLGNKQWEKFYGGTTYDKPTNIAVCNDGGYIYCTTTKSGGVGLPNYNIRVMKIDSVGNMMFNKFYGGVYNDNSHAIIQTQDGGYVVAMAYAIDTTTGTRTYASLLKLDTAGNLLWLKKVPPFKGNGPDSFQSVLELSDGSLVAAGLNHYTDSIAISRYHGLVAKISSTGDLVWQREHNLSTSNTADSYLYDIRTTSDGGFICSGVANSPQDMWLLKLDSLGCADTACALATAVEEVEWEVRQLTDLGAFSIYPNPAHSFITVELQNLTTEFTFSLIDVTGKEVLRKPIQSFYNQINIQTLPKGIYFYMVTNKKERYSGKLIIQ